MTDDEEQAAFEAWADEVDAANKAWKERWPNHCTNCEGRGGFHVPATRWEPEDYDLCVCAEAGNCPRCGTVAWAVDNEDETPCPTCHWNWGKGKDDAAPQI